MSVCDICGSPGTWTLVGSENMREAVFGGGFNPYAVGLASGAPDPSGTYLQWRNTIVAQDTSDWNICAKCMTILASYLKRPVTAAGVSHSDVSAHPVLSAMAGTMAERKYSPASSMSGIEPELVPIRCEQCQETYVLGRDALVVTATSVLQDFQVGGAVVKSAHGIESSPDLVERLGRPWDDLSPSDIRGQAEAIREIRKEGSPTSSRRWTCRKCGREQSYRFIATKTIQVEGKTIAEAKAIAESRLSDGKIILLKVVQNPGAKVVQAHGRTDDEALASARTRVPNGACEVGQAVLREPCRSGSLRIEAYAEKDVTEACRANAPAGASVVATKCEVVPKKGFLGIGRKKGVWTVSWSTQALAEVSVALSAVIEIVAVE